MRMDAFSRCHPAVNFLFFVGAISFGVVIQHPVYLLAGILSGAVYYLLLHGRSGIKMLAWLLPPFLILTAVNPLFNTYGTIVLFHVFGRPYTMEALMYGAAIASVFVVMLLWFGCYNAVMTSDKFTSLFGNLIPALSLLLVMVLRMIPNLMRRAGQISSVRKSVGKGFGEQTSNKEKIEEGMTVLSSLSSWALEGSIVTADSMRSRGYGCTKRTSFTVYRMTASDWGLLAIMVLLIISVIIAAATGCTKAVFTPEWEIAPVAGVKSFGLAAYFVYLLIPTALHIKEAVQWHISRSKI